MTPSHFTSGRALTVAFDIETVPARAFGDWPEQIRAYLERRIAKAQTADPSMDYGKFASINAAFGRIACIAVARVDESDDGREMIIARSFTGDETTLLEEFQDTFVRFDPLYVSFNGLAFDVPFVLARLRYLGLACRLRDFSDTRRFRHDPHCDLLEVLSNWDRSKAINLEVAAFLAGVPTPKAALDGSRVGEAFAQGRIEEICRYCERDVAATLNVHRRLILHQIPVHPSRCYWKEADRVLHPIDFQEERPKECAEDPAAAPGVDAGLVLP